MAVKKSFTGKELGGIAISDLPQIGEARARMLKKLGIHNLFDLLFYLPRRYEDRRTTITPLKDLQPGDVVTVAGVIGEVEEVHLKKGMSLIRATLSCRGETVTAIWFNQPFLRKTLRKGLSITVTGKLERSLFGWEIRVVDYETGNGVSLLHVGRIVPVYGSSEDLSQRYLRRMMFQCVRNFARWVRDLLPEEVRQTLGLMSLPEALLQIHFPDGQEQLAKARERLVFEELFWFQSGLIRIQQTVQLQGVPRVPKSDLPERYLSTLPFPLTTAQKRAIDEIRRDLQSERRMFRLLQGDVGCGKTVVAIYSLLYAVAAGYQGALMAPTEVLAEQHYLSLGKTAERLGVKVRLLTGALSKRAREELLEGAARGDVNLVVGTHALLEKEVSFHSLGLVVIDEQHRFGVQQRDLLLSKGSAADVLVMTATPIPRSLTLTVYGELDLTVIDEMPPQRKGVKTYFLPVREKHRVYQFLKKELLAGRQAYVVCPLIEESDRLEYEAASRRAAELTTELPEYRVGLLHGRMKIEEKEEVMEAFRKGEIHLLVATSVIEVGIDVPNASLIIIEGAERFGLSQLHQLRGRVGRGDREGYCVLVGNPQTREAVERIKTLVKCSDGFQVAERDLSLRGPGELLGTRQHGLSDFRVVDILKDIKYLEKARAFAVQYQGRLSREALEEISFRFPTLAYSLKF